MSCRSSRKKLQAELLEMQDELERLDKELSYFKEGDSRRPCRRAVLVICENIGDGDVVRKRLKEEFSDTSQFNIYQYDRSYKEMEKDKLDAGDIVVATNIAGRGTDLDCSAEVNRNGGLHVIVAYMPANLRVAQQAFGRTARKGNEGTGTYIVRAPPGVDKTVYELEQERDSREARRLDKVEQDQFPKIQCETDLFHLFEDVYERSQRDLGGDKEPEEEFELQKLQLQSDGVKNSWALWLDRMDERISRVHEGKHVRDDIMEASYLSMGKLYICTTFLCL